MFTKIESWHPLLELSLEDTGASKQLEVRLSDSPNVVPGASEHPGKNKKYSIFGKPCYDEVLISVNNDVSSKSVSWGGGGGGGLGTLHVLR